MKNQVKRVNKAEKCKEDRCRGKVPRNTKSLESWTCHLLGLCRYCYRMKFNHGQPSNRPSGQARISSQRPLSYDDRTYLEERAFEGMERFIWSPGFYRDWKAYIKARKKGELRG